MVELGELMMILELHRQGLSVTAIARRTGRDPKTVRKYIERGVEAPVYGPRLDDPAGIGIVGEAHHKARKVDLGLHARRGLEGHLVGLGSVLRPGRGQE